MSKTKECGYCAKPMNVTPGQVVKYHKVCRAAGRNANSRRQKKV